MLVEIWTDLVCPWCYVGKRRFESALDGWEHRDEVEVAWRSFELDPTAPPERPGSLDDLLVRKYRMSPAEASAAHDRLRRLGEEVGLDLRFDLARVGATFDAHRLVQVAAAHGVGGQVQERLMRAYFTEGVLLSDHAELLRLAVDAGLAAEIAAEALASGAGAEEVRADEARATELGVTGVPFALVDRRFAVAGAQGSDVFTTALERARQRRLEVGPPVG